MPGGQDENTHLQFGTRTSRTSVGAILSGTAGLHAHEHWPRLTRLRLRNDEVPETVVEVLRASMIAVTLTPVSSFSKAPTLNTSNSSSVMVVSVSPWASIRVSFRETIGTK